MVAYPKDWKSGVLGDFGHIQMCRRIFQSQTRPIGQIPFYKIGTFGKKADAYISRGLYEEYKSLYPYPEKGDVLISAAGTVGRTVIFDGRDSYFQDSNIVWLKVNGGEIDHSYLDYYYQSYPWRNLEGTTINRLYNEIILTTPIHLPPKPEQEAIARALGDIDQYISDLSELIEKKRNIRSGVVLNLVTGHERLKGFSDEWGESSLADIGFFTKGAQLSKADISMSGTPLILYGELYTTYGEVALEVFRCTNREVEDKYYSRIGDVIIPTSGETAEEIATSTCVMMEGVILGGDLNIYRTVELDGRFLSYVINHVANQKIAEIAQGISIVHINAKELGKIVVKYPSIPEQEAIADVIATMDDEIKNLEAERDKMIQIREGAMDDLLTGKVRLLKGES